MIVMDAMPMRWARSAVIQSIEIIARLLEVLSAPGCPRLPQVPLGRRECHKRPNAARRPPARRIVAQQHELKVCSGAAGPLQRRRNVFAIASESARMGAPFEKASKSMHDLLLFNCSPTTANR